MHLETKIEKRFWWDCRANFLNMGTGARAGSPEMTFKKGI